MARLYNGWNGLQIGQSINDLNQRKHENLTSAWDTFATGLQKGIDDNRKAAEEKRKKDAAMQYAQSAGVTPEQAKFLSGMSPEQIYAHGQQLENENRAEGRTLDAEKRAEGRTIAAEKRQRGYQAEDHKRDRLELLTDEDRKREFENIDKETARRQKIEDTEYGALNNRLIALQTKSDLGLSDENTQNEINETKTQIDDWLLKHPDYTSMMFGRLNQDAPKIVTRQSILRDLNGFIGEDGSVDPTALKDWRENLLREHGIDINAVNDEGVKGLYNLVYKKQKGNKGERGAKNLGAEGVKTEEDAGNDLKIQKERARIQSVQRSAEKYIKNQNESDPNISEADLEKLPAKIANNYRSTKRRRGVK